MDGSPAVLPRIETPRVSARQDAVHGRGALAEATPDTRNRVVDFLRALAILVVAFGHWTAAAVVVRDGSLVPDQILNLATWTHPLTWVIQVMPVFFMVAATRMRCPGALLAVAARVCRVVAFAPASPRHPVIPLLIVWLAIASIAYAAGVPGGTLRTASQVALVPTWFLAAYVMVVALAPATLALWERLGWWAVPGFLLLGGLVDLVSIRTGAICPVSELCHRVRRGPHDRVRLARRATARHTNSVAAGRDRCGGHCPARLARPYPVSMVGLDNATFNNSFPTRVTLGFLGLLQGGLLLALEPVLERWLRRPKPWRFTILVNARIMTLYLWHLTAMVLVIGVSLALGGFGLHSEPLSGAWWATRPLWWAVLAAVTIGCIAVFGRFNHRPG